MGIRNDQWASAHSLFQCIWDECTWDEQPEPDRWKRVQPYYKPEDRIRRNAPGRWRITNKLLPDSFHTALLNRSRSQGGRFAGGTPSPGPKRRRFWRTANWKSGSGPGWL